MTNYLSIRNLRISKGFFLRNKASFVCFVLLNEMFHEIHVQHNFMVIGHNLIICDDWACLNHVGAVIVKYSSNPHLFTPISEELNTARSESSKWLFWCVEQNFLVKP